MKQTFQVVVTKSFLVTVEAENQQNALEFAEIFTSDIQDLSSEKDRQEHNFSIDEIENTFTQAQILEPNE